MVKKLTLGQNKNPIAMDSKNGVFVKIMALPILAIIFNLTATSITRAKPTSYEVPENTPSNQPLLISTLLFITGILQTPDR